MQFQFPLLAVKDVEKSKKFYTQLFDQQVVLDLGTSLTFSGGFAVQQNFAKATGIPTYAVMKSAHNIELYFETEDLDAFIQKLDCYPDVTFLHPLKTLDSHQRIVRIYDPDHYIIKIGESFPVLVKRLYAAGHSPEEIAQMIQRPASFVQECLSNIKKQQTQ